MREFVRHPTDIPVYLVLDGESVGEDTSLINVSQGGVAMRCDFPIERGDLIHINITDVQPVYHGRGVVCWCKPLEVRQPGDPHFEVGVCFVDEEEAFQSRMVEQVCQIQHYKNKLESELGREVSSEEAAQEWIVRYAADFYQPQEQDEAGKPGSEPS